VVGETLEIAVHTLRPRQGELYARLSSRQPYSGTFAITSSRHFLGGLLASASVIFGPEEIPKGEAVKHECSIACLMGLLAAADPRSISELLEVLHGKDLKVHIETGAALPADLPHSHSEAPDDPLSPLSRVAVNVTLSATAVGAPGGIWILGPDGIPRRG